MATYSFEYHKVNSSQELTKVEQTLLKKTRRLCHKAYAPYSNFLVGSMVLLAND